jgi:hypothetical protein
MPPIGPLATGAMLLPLFGGLFLGLSTLAGIPFAGRRRIPAS